MESPFFRTDSNCSKVKKQRLNLPKGLHIFYLYLSFSRLPGGISDAVQLWRWRQWRNGNRGQKSTRNKAGDTLKKSPDHCNADRLTFTYTFKPGIMCGQNSHQPYICPTSHSSANTTVFIYRSKSESSCKETKLFITQRIFGGKLSGCLTNVYLVACHIQSSYSIKLTHPFVFSVIQMPENFMTSSYNMLAAQRCCSLQLYPEWATMCMWY